jgi:hypothetical protein
MVLALSFVLEMKKDSAELPMAVLSVPLVSEFSA